MGNKRFRETSSLTETQRGGHTAAAVQVTTSSMLKPRAPALRTSGWIPPRPQSTSVGSSTGLGTKGTFLCSASRSLLPSGAACQRARQERRAAAAKTEYVDLYVCTALGPPPSDDPVRRQLSPLHEPPRVGACLLLEDEADVRLPPWQHPLQHRVALSPSNERGLRVEHLEPEAQVGVRYLVRAARAARCAHGQALGHESGSDEYGQSMVDTLANITGNMGETGPGRGRWPPGSGHTRRSERVPRGVCRRRPRGAHHLA